MLHLLNFEQCLPTSEQLVLLVNSISVDTDTVVFMNTPKNNSANASIEAVITTGCDFYSLRELSDVSLPIPTITMDDLVNLTETHNPINSWY